MSIFSSESHKRGLVPENINEMSTEEVLRFVKTLDSNSMGFDGAECCEDFDMSEKPIISRSTSGESIGNGLTIVNYHTTVNFSDQWNPKKFLVVHYTAGTVDNGSAAYGNACYFKNVYRGASANYFVDCTNTIYRCVSDDKVAWHCGAYTYYHNSCRNENSIGVEICSYKENGVYKFKDATYKNALNLCRYIVKKYNIPKENVLMHYHVTHKVCAAPFMSNSVPTSAWDKFKNAIYENEIKIEPYKNNGNVAYTNGSQLNVRKYPDENSEIIGKYNEGDKVNLIGKYNDWYVVDYQNGYVLKKYVQECHWSDPYRDDLLNKKVITNKKDWSFPKHTDVITRALAVQILSNVYGGAVKKSSDPHWATAAVKNLVKHKVIEDESQWKTNLDSPITKALFLALLAKATGGISDKYKNRTVDHWGRNALDTLCDIKIIETPESWTKFEGQITKDLLLAIISKSYSKIK